MKNVIRILSVFLLVTCFGVGCSQVDPPPIGYLAAECPDGVIESSSSAAFVKEFPRGGWYIANSKKNFFGGRSLS